MKRFFAVALFAVMLLSAMTSACAETEAEKAAPDHGWTLPDTIEMTSAVTEVFDKAMKDMVGVDYEPLCYLGEKDGTYCILCRATVVYPGAEPGYALVYVNDDGVQNIWDIWLDKHANP